MKLYDTPLAPNPRRVRWFMAEKGIEDIEVVRLNLMEGEHRAADYVAKAGLANVPMLLAPWSALMSFRPLAMYSSAVCQSTEAHRSPCLIIGLVRRSLLLRAS